MSVDVTSAEYWDAPSGKMGGIFAAAKRLTSHDGSSGGEKSPVGADVKLDMHQLTLPKGRLSRLKDCY